jgi:hypothetical protein
MGKLHTKSKRKGKRALKIILWAVLCLFVIAGALFTYGYFHYGSLIRTFLTDAIYRESKGIYRAEIGSLYLNVLDGNLTVKNVEIAPDTALYRRMSATDTLSPVLFRLKINRFRIAHFRILDAIRERKIDVESIRFIQPEITILRMQSSKKAKSEKSSKKLLAIPLPKGWKSISIREIEFDKGRLDFYDLSGDSVIHQAVPSCSIMIRNILVDSLHQGKRRLFNADDISVDLKGLSFLAKNGMNRFSVGEFGFSTGKRSAYVKKFHMVPQFNRNDYTRKLGYQTDRMDVLVGKILIQRLDFRELILGGGFRAGMIRIDSLVIDDYRDKRVPKRPGFKPPMPQDGIRKLKMYVKIDSVVLNGGKATYSEQVGDEPGSLFFDKMKGTFTGLTNDSMLLHAGLVSELKGTAYLMGKGKLDATVRFRFGDKKNAFTFSGVLGAIDLREINPMLTKLLPAEVKSGKIKEMVIPLVEADDDVAKGNLLFYYNDLSIAMTTKEQTTWNSIKKGVVNWVANDIVVNNDNPTKSGKMKTGVVLFHRDKEKGIINFLWKSTFSGLKSTMGFNSKEQKAIKKDQAKKKNH